MVGAVFRPLRVGDPPDLIAIGALALPLLPRPVALGAFLDSPLLPVALLGLPLPLALLRVLAALLLAVALGALAILPLLLAVDAALVAAPLVGIQPLLLTLLLDPLAILPNVAPLLLAIQPLLLLALALDPLLLLPLLPLSLDLLLALLPLSPLHLLTLLPLGSLQLLALSAMLLPDHALLLPLLLALLDTWLLLTLLLALLLLPASAASVLARAEVGCRTLSGCREPLLRRYDVSGDRRQGSAEQSSKDGDACQSHNRNHGQPSSDRFCDMLTILPDARLTFVNSASLKIQFSECESQAAAGVRSSRPRK